MLYRIGQGLDVHAFCDGDFVMLGGVRIPHERGISAHSDGDVALHALCDALLGALALGDIGQHFPPSDEQWKDAAGADLLSRVVEMVWDRGWQVGNIDLTIICEAPRIGPHVKAMQAVISEILQAEAEQVSVKATTTEELGYTGRGEGISAHAVVLMETTEK